MTICKQLSCAEHLTLACSAINLTLQDIKTTFNNKEIREVNYSYGEEKDFLLEIRLDAATLTCRFNEFNICNGAFLFLDDVMDITHYVEYCNKTYPCNLVFQAWVTSGCLIRINTENKECNLSVTSIK